MPSYGKELIPLIYEAPSGIHKEKKITQKKSRQSKSKYIHEEMKITTKQSNKRFVNQNVLHQLKINHFYNKRIILIVKGKSQ